MSFLIAISGKGGVGKTTLSSLIVSRLIARGCQPVLAVDADPNTCLDSALGVKVEKTIGRVREEAREEEGAGEGQAPHRAPHLVRGLAGVGSVDVAGREEEHSLGHAVGRDVEHGAVEGRPADADRAVAAARAAFPA